MEAEEATTGKLRDLEAQIVALQKRFADLSMDELLRLQSLSKQKDAMRAKLDGSGILQQGEGNLAAKERSAIVGRDVGGSIVTGDNNSVTQIRNVYLGASGCPALSEEAFNEALGRYLGWVEQRYGCLNLRGVEKREQKALTLTLGDIYVSLAADVTPERKQRHTAHRPDVLPDAERDEERVEPVDMNRLLPLSQRLVITGGPGCGKTTYLHLIAASLAQAIRLNQPGSVAAHLGLTSPLPLPIIVALSEFNQYRRQHHRAADPHQGTLIAFISHSLIRQQAAIGLPPDFFERLLVQGRACLLLLDGLDEVANERERVLVARAVEYLAHNEGVRQMVLTSRSRAYQGDAVLPETFRLAMVQPMSPEQVAALAGRWCQAVYDDTRANQEANSLEHAIASLEQVRKQRGEPRLADTPLMVTIIAIVHYNQRRLPDQRAELYEKCVEVLLTEGHHDASEATYELADWGGSLPEKRGLLAFLAFEMMHAGAKAGSTVRQGQMERWLRPRLLSRYGEAQAEAQLEGFVRTMRERGSLLDERGGRYQFSHLTFQEFLCAYHLAEAVRDPGKIAMLWAEGGRYPDPWWRETILLTVGYLGVKSMETALELVQEMATQPGRDEAALAAAELAGVAFMELESQDAKVKTIVVNQLVALLTDPQVMAPPLLRLLGGDALGRLGDPRPGVCTLEPDLIPISVGPFLMGEEKHAVTIQEPYAIGRCPVTNAQFQMFVDDGGYTEQWQRCWPEDGWRWREDNRRTGPRDWGKQFSGANQPVVRVTWYEAVAYSRWLAAKTGKPYRLPTEAEWERAARHTDGRTYPWGETWQDGIANTKEAELGGTTAVGVFPGDTAVGGALDMGGNVWEWCQTRWRDEKGNNYPLPYRHDDGREALAGGNEVRRVIRGGVRGGEKKWSRCSARSGYDPDVGDLVGAGFRLALSPFFDSGL